LKLIWSLEKLGEWEIFRASRYIWEKLFLVTFEQTDPLFAIDVSNPKAPKVLWELKIPGYSTYLHPYDDNHLIWLWFDTKENQWWWVVQAWLKVDLYQINYDKKCGDANLTNEEKAKCNSWDYKWIIVKQLASKVLWWQWSSSEATYNPRMFMWNNATKQLFLPVTLMNYDNNYRSKDFFQWLSTLNIDLNSWISEDYRITHIDTTGLEAERLKECKRYSTWTSEPLCKTLITWEEYCSSNNTRYVPTSWYADSPISEYLVNQSWNYQSSFINRALWVWKEVYAISNNKIWAYEMSSGVEEWNVSLK
jgi:hypothetical protein